MPTSYPASFDALTNPASADPLTSPSHASQHANANDAIEAIQVRAGRTGTAFPATPATGARFLRTDSNIEYYYDGTRWLSAGLLSLSMGAANAVSTTGDEYLRVANSHALGLGMYIVSISIAAYVSTTNDASNYWSFRMTSQDANTFTQIGSTVNTSATAAGTWASYSLSSIGHVGTTANEAYTLRIAKTGAPGTVSATAVVYYRLIG